jgi:hypothetical protein
MALIEGYPELNYYANLDGSSPVPSYTESVKPDKTEKEQRSLFALETQLQKTKLCRYHMKGLCKHGSDCRFAHGKDQLVQPPNLQKTRMCPDLQEKGVCNNPHCTFAHHENELKKVNICHKTAVCTWFLAGKCRNGVECDFAHGEHELKGNAATLLQTGKNQKQQVEQPEQQEQMPQADGNGGYGRKEPMFIQSSMTKDAPVPPPYQAHDAGQFLPDQLQQTFMPPVVPPPPAPPGFMPTLMPGMSPYDAGYQYPPQQDPTMHFNYMGMQAPMMQQFPGVVDPVRSLPPGLSVGAVVVPTPTPQASFDPQNAQKSWQLTELAVQINMLSEEVKRLQEATIRNTQYQGSGNSGSSTRSSSGDNRTPRAGVAPQHTSTGASSSTGGSSSGTGAPDLDACRSFEEKVQHLQNELKRVMDEGQRCGKIRQTDTVVL